MSQQNLISIELAEADLLEIKSAIQILKDKLEPHLKSLSPKDKKELPKMGDKTLSFVQKSLEYCGQNKELVPSFLDIAEFKRDLSAVELLRELHQPLIQIVEALEDSQALAGSDAYQAALMFYTSVKSAKRSNIPNAQTIYEDLSSRFPGKRFKKSADSSAAKEN